MAKFSFGTEVATLTIALFVAGYCVGPLFWGPLSEQYGRKPVFLISFTAYTGFQVGCALSQNTASILIFRFLGGVFAAAPLANSGCARLSESRNSLIADVPPQCCHVGRLGRGHARQGDGALRPRTFRWSYNRPYRERLHGRRRRIVALGLLVVDNVCRLMSCPRHFYSARDLCVSTYDAYLCPPLTASSQSCYSGEARAEASQGDRRRPLLGTAREEHYELDAADEARPRPPVHHSLPRAHAFGHHSVHECMLDSPLAARIEY